MGLGKPARFVKASRPRMPPVPVPQTRGQRIREKLRGLRKKYEAKREAQRKSEISRAKKEISRGKVLLKRDKLRARQAETTRRLVKAGGGSFKERMQYSQGSAFGGMMGQQGPAQRRPRKSRPKKKQTRRRRAQPQQKSPLEKLMWG